MACYAPEGTAIGCVILIPFPPSVSSSSSLLMARRISSINTKAVMGYKTQRTATSGEIVSDAADKSLMLRLF